MYYLETPQGNPKEAGGSGLAEEGTIWDALLGQLPKGWTSHNKQLCLFYEEIQ